MLRNAPALRGRALSICCIRQGEGVIAGYSWQLVAYLGFPADGAASVCFAFTFGFWIQVLQSGMSCSCKFYNTCAGDAFSNLPSPENRGSEKQQLIVPDRLKERELGSTGKEGLKGAYLHDFLKLDWILLLCQTDIDFCILDC